MMFYLIWACHTNKDPAPIHVEENAFVEVSAKPPNTQIWLNEQIVEGERFAVPKGRHTVKLTRKGFESHRQEIVIDAPVQLRLQIELEPTLVPFHFSLDNPEEPLLVRSGTKEETVQGAFSGDVWAGMVDVFAPERSQPLLWSGWVDEEVSLQRCSGPSTQKSICIAHHELSETPKSLLFFEDELWISFLTHPSVVRVYEHEVWRLKSEIQTNGWGIFREYEGRIYFLRTKDSVLIEIEPRKKTILQQTDMPGAWASDFDFLSDGIVVSNWQSNRLTLQQGSELRTIDLHEPRGVLAFEDGIWVNSYEEARLTQIQGEEQTTLFQNDGAFQELFWDEQTRSLLIADVKSGVVWQHRLDDRETSALITLEKKTLRSLLFLPENRLLLLGVQHKGSRYSYGRGEVLAYNIDSNSFVDAIEAGEAPTYLAASKDERFLAVADLSGQTVHLYDLKPIQKILSQP